MFQSDDFDVILTDEAFSVIDRDICLQTPDSSKSTKSECNVLIDKLNGKNIRSPPKKQPTLFAHNPIHVLNQLDSKSDTPNKRKRKFPGPAGLLPDVLPEKVSDNLRNVVQSSQNFSCSQNQVPPTAFDEGPWRALQNDIRSSPSDSRCLSQNTIARVKELALANRLDGRKVSLLAGIVQSVDRNLQDPLIVLRDTTAEIQCTLHRDAWEQLSPYLIPQYSVMLLKNTTVLTTGSALKKIYLSITNNNIVSVYSDEENSYILVGNSIALSTYSLEKIQMGTDNISVLRNISVREHTRKSISGNNINESTIQNETSDDMIAQTLLEGISTDFFEDDL